MQAADGNPIDPRGLEVRCPKCGCLLWQERAGDWTLKARILRYQAGAFVALCPEQGCRGEPQIPWLVVSGDPATHKAPPRRRVLVRTLDTARGTGER
jgi:hypothetical protein